MVGSSISKGIFFIEFLLLLLNFFCRFVAFYHISLAPTSLPSIVNLHIIIVLVSGGLFGIITGGNGIYSFIKIDAF